MANLPLTSEPEFHPRVSMRAFSHPSRDSGMCLSTAGLCPVLLLLPKLPLTPTGACTKNKARMWPTVRAFWLNTTSDSRCHVWGNLQMLRDVSEGVRLLPKYMTPRMQSILKLLYPLSPQDCNLKWYFLNTGFCPELIFAERFSSHPWCYGSICKWFIKDYILPYCLPTPLIQDGD